MAHTVMINGEPHRYSKAAGGYVLDGPERPGPKVGQCDGCPAGSSVLCGECRLCVRHCASDGCGYSPHAWQAYDPDPYEGYDVVGNL